MSLRFRRPSRKSSTPFFPGAWPSTPAHGNASDSCMVHAEDIEALGQSQRSTSSSNRPNVPSPAHLEHVVNFHRRISQSYANLVRSPRQPNPSNSVTSSPAIRSHPTSPVLSDVSTTASDGIHTPEDYPTNFPQGPFITHSKASPDQFGQAPSRPPRHPSRTSSATYAQTGSTRKPFDSRRLSIQLDAPLLNFTPGLPPLDLPSHQLAFSPESVNSYFSTDNERASGMDVDFPEPPSYSSSSSSLAISEGRSSLPLPGLATTFFPVSEHQTTEWARPPASSLSGSSVGLSTDSPVLPSDNGLSPTSAYEVTSPNQHLSPSSADMDAFGLAATNSLLLDSRSVLSIPTSFRSTSAQGSISLDDTAQGHACRRSSVSTSSLLELSSEVNGQVVNYPLAPNRRSGAPSPSPSLVSRSEVNARTRTVSAQVVALANTDKPKKNPYKGGKLLSLNKVKQIGSRIKNLFKGKVNPTTPRDTVFGVTTTTATVEYTSEHPIPRRRSVSRIMNTPLLTPRSHTSPVFMFSSKKRRQSMPAGAGSMPDVSQPRPLRPVSFLAMDSRNHNSSRHLLSTPSVIGLTRNDAHQKSQPKKQQHRQSVVYVSHHDNKRGIDIDSTRYPPPVRSRTRTQTAPASSKDNARRNSRRFSLSSALGDAIRTTVIPHPPLPLPQQADRHAVYGRLHRRSASTSAGDAWNAAKARSGRNVEVSPPASPKAPEAERVATQDSSDERADPRDRSGATFDSGHLGDTLMYQEAILLPGNREYGGRSRSHTQSTIQGPSGPASSEIKRRSRGFSLSSAISKRALKARSMIVGRNVDVAVPAIPPQYVQTGGLTTSISGISFDMLTSGTDSLRSRREDAGSGCAEYDPNLVLDRMSFAETPEVSSTEASCTNLSLNPGLSTLHPSFSRDGYFSAESSSSIASEEDTPMHEDVEEREFMRTLGLEFDAIVERARSE
ncbi:unnamed protein product [Somion occarium]|uniref:Uncharacterized protein n=1 Tax=Somion occarium TaxID=3059160 RepID=A0ABP1CJU6_9APHY